METNINGSMEEKESRSRALLYLKLAFLAMEPSSCILSLATEAGGGCITAQVQNFIVKECFPQTLSREDKFLTHDSILCIDHTSQLMNETAMNNQAYIKGILKRLIAAIEPSPVSVEDCLYEELARYLTIGGQVQEKHKIYREISFLCPDFDDSVNLVARLLCSSNMLEGDTGFSPINRALRLIGAGVGLVGIVLSHVGASKVTLTDGDLFTLANMKVNLELNNLCSSVTFDTMHPSAQKVECRHLAWELATKAELQDQQPDIVLGADIIYNPECIPHLVQVFTFLLEGKREVPIAYIATVIRNMDTFKYFLTVARESRLSIVDVTSKTEVPNLLPYMHSYEPSSVHLLRVSLLSE